MADLGVDDAPPWQRRKGPDRDAGLERLAMGRDGAGGAPAAEAGVCVVRENSTVGR